MILIIFIIHCFTGSNKEYAGAPLISNLSSSTHNSGQSYLGFPGVEQKHYLQYKGHMFLRTAQSLQDRGCAALGDNVISPVTCDVTPDVTLSSGFNLRATLVS